MVESPDVAPTTRPGVRTNPDDKLIQEITALADHARVMELPLADELLTDMLATLNGWPVNGLSRLR